jgi:glucokinase
VTTIGIDLGGTKAHAVRWEAGAVVAEARRAKPAAGLGSPEAFATIRDLWADDVTAIGAGVAGLVSDGVFVWGPHVDGAGVDVGAVLEDEFGVPAVVDNDANAGAFAELRLGAGRGHRDLLYVTVGTGIGGTIVMDGEIRRGVDGFAGEWGHLTVDPDGLPCACGSSGCWETKVSGRALQRADAEGRSPEGVAAAASEGDPTALHAVDRVGTALGLGLAGLVAIFDPALVIVGGGVAGLGELLLRPARTALADHLHGRPRRTPPPIVTATLGPAANAIGAALLAEGASPDRATR